MSGNGTSQDSSGSPIQKIISRDEIDAILQRRRVAFRLTENVTPASERAGVSNSQNNHSDNGTQLDDVVGLALSGGGLRSALFNDGFLQALSHNGVLRYVDYLCSVSGGGYIAGHLMTHSKPAKRDSNGQKGSSEEPANSNNSGDKNTGSAEQGNTLCTNHGQKETKSMSENRSDHTFNGQPNFHEEPTHWHFGRDPVTGFEDPQRLEGVGGYLNRTLEFFTGFVTRQLPVMLLYLSAVGILSTIIALFYRSFDDPVFRMTYFTGLGIRFGNELMIAFIPTLVIVGLCLLLAMFIWILELFVTSDSKKMKSWRERLYFVNRILIAVLLLAVLSSIAVYLGNDLTKFTGNPSVESSSSLNRFALQLGIAAAIVQILVFLGKDKLFRSEQAEAARWKKSLQAVISYGVIGLAVFAMIHAMARENISGYTDYRDPYLVQGEVANWPLLVTIFERYENRDISEEEIASKVKEVDYTQEVVTKYLGASNARRHWKLFCRSTETSNPESQLERADSKNSTLMSNGQWVCTLARILVLGSTYPPRMYSDASAFRKAQLSYLESKSHLLESSDFTVYLLNYFKAQQQEPVEGNKILGVGIGSTNELPNSPILQSFAMLQKSEHIKNRLALWSMERRGLLERLLHEHDLGALPSRATGHFILPAPFSKGLLSGGLLASDLSLPPRIRDRVRLNRDLLELLGKNENLLKRIDIASTPVIQPHDQAVRWQWLSGWLILFGAALILTKDLNRNSFLFQFYRKSIRRFFLTRKMGFVEGATLLKDLVPWESGLPFPIYLCAWLQPPRAQGSGNTACGVALTPLGMRIYTKPKAKNCKLPTDLRLKDAVAISGSAVEPNMTNNTALKILMDFLGARLGMWLMWRKANLSDGSSRSAGSSKCVVTVCFALVICISLFICVFTREPLWVSILALNSYLSCFILALMFHGLGYPSILLSHWKIKREQRKKADDSNFASTEAKTENAPQPPPMIFVSDGGFYDYLGVTELLRRQCDLIIVSDAGVNKGETTLESLAKMCERASSEFGVRFVDLDHDSPIEFGRLKRHHQDYVPQPYIAIRIKYYDTAPRDPSQQPDNNQPKAEAQQSKEGLLIYAQMAITDKDPIEIQQIRHRFPSFPDEPTTNQFYTPDQVAAYRDLGYHIGSRLCSQMERWTADDIKRYGLNNSSGEKQPLFAEMKRRLRRSYVQACYEEYYYKEDDVCGESVWSDCSEISTNQYPTFAKAVDEFASRVKAKADANHGQDVGGLSIAEFWLDQYASNADVRSRYLLAVSLDINKLSTEKLESNTFNIQSELRTATQMAAQNLDAATLLSHYVVLAVAAQQLHRGIPHASFQVAGRQKLFSVISSLCDDLIGKIIPQPAGEVDCDEIAAAIVHEVYELTNNIFQSADNLVAITFVQCICKEIAEILTVRNAYVNPPPKGNGNGKNTPQQPTKSYKLSLDFRQLLMESLQLGYRTRVESIIAAYLYFLATGKNDYYDGSQMTATKIIEPVHRQEYASLSPKPR